MKQDKMVKVAGSLHTLAKVAGEIFKAFAIVCIVFTVLVAVFGEKVYVPGTVSLDLDYVKIHLAEEYQVVTGLMKVYTILGLIAGCGLCFLLQHVMRLTLEILAPMKEGRPFEASAPESLRKIALWVLIGGAALQVVGIVERVILVQAFPMDAIFASAAVGKVEYVFGMDFGFMVLGAVILLLSYVFSYGKELQRLSDETL